MPTLNAGIVTISFELNYPNVEGEIDLVIPDHIPKYGGKTITLDQFSLTLQSPQITIPLNLEFFEGSVTIELDMTNCQVLISGGVEIHFGHRWRWTVGPASISYMNPLSFTEPSWSQNPVTLDATTLQTAINSAPAQNTGTASGPPSVHNDEITQAALRGLLTFCGASNLIADMQAMAKTLNTNYAEALQDNAGTPRAPEADTSGVVLGFGFSGTGAALGGPTGGGGIYFTESGDFGIYGTVGVDAGLILELSAGFTGFIYWPDGGQSAMDCFQGLNFFVGIDGGEEISASITVSWPENRILHTTATAPCGAAVSLGVGFGAPVNFFAGNSDTWGTLIPPP